jgi:hypothetical protein
MRNPLQGPLVGSGTEEFVRTSALVAPLSGLSRAETTHWREGDSRERSPTGEGWEFMRRGIFSSSGHPGAQPESTVWRVSDAARRVLIACLWARL